MGFLSFLFGSKETEDGEPKVQKFMVLTGNGDFEMEVRGDGRLLKKLSKKLFNNTQMNTT